MIMYQLYHYDKPVGHPRTEEQKKEIDQSKALSPRNYWWKPIVISRRLRVVK